MKFSTSEPEAELRGRTRAGAVLIALIAAACVQPLCVAQSQPAPPATFSIETPQFTLRLVESSQTVAA
ncbi:MAG TPA: hypothetical protein VFJ10_07350, partial [Acidobacteriaceae bacterium]|nr:hypothetical protein [Acidobacteriaceae bacterium]